MIGQTIAHYKILEKLGEGGMGVVYKARDTKLDRLVALKFLPSHLSASEEDKARFIQEAKAASAINHPNICTIYAIDEHDKQLFIAMEFVDGQTLRDKSRSQTPNLKSAIDTGIQIADGLAAAHEKGIVHRDIKPENIMVRKDGIAQIMDFGLAKLQGVSRLTKEGSTVGTAGYMSPEQIQGQDADHRSDIFSFGVLLYELLTGQLPFKGVHETALAYEIVNVDAPPMSSMKPDIDQNLDAIVLDCLEKDPKERCQSIAEVARDLRRIKRESTRQRHTRVTMASPVLRQSKVSGGFDAERTTGEHPAGPTRRDIPAWIITAAVAVVMLGVGYGLSFLNRPPTRDLPFIRATIEMPPGIRYHDGIGGHSALSPDGSMIVFAATDSQSRHTLWVRELHSNEGKRLPGTESATYPFWSPDSRSLGFFADGKLKTIDANGGPVLTLADAPFGRGAVWTATGRILFSPNTSEPHLLAVPVSGGTVEPAVMFDTSLHSVPRFPEMLPDANHLVVSLLGIAGEQSHIYLASLDRSPPRRLITDGAYPRYASGHLFFLRQGILMAQIFDPSSLALTGTPVAIQDGVNSWAPRSKADYSVTEGLLVYSASGTAQTGDLMWMQPDGTESVIGQFDIVQAFELSPDETRIAYEASDGNKRRIWIYDVVARVRTQLTFDADATSGPRWSNDSKVIYFNREVAASKANIFAKRADGSGDEVLIARGEEGSAVGYYPSDTSPDGRYLLVVMQNESMSELGTVDLSDTRRPIPVQKTGINGSSARFSPDGKWIVYRSSESNTSRLNIASFQGRPGMWQLAADAEGALWGNKGIEYFSRARDRYEIIEVSLSSGNPVFGPPQPLLKGRSQGVFVFGLSRDGKRYLVFRPANAGAGGNLSLIVNWKSLLESKQQRI